MRCWCGRRLHYSDQKIRREVERFNKERGEFVKVTNLETGKAYLVQRHYIVLHGLLGGNLPILGFKEAKKL